MWRYVLWWFEPCFAFVIYCEIYVVRRLTAFSAAFGVGFGAVRC